MTYCAAVSSLGGIFCVGQIVCEALGRGVLNKQTAPDFRDFWAAFSDDTPDDLVGDGHLVGLVGVCPPPPSSACWKIIFHPMSLLLGCSAAVSTLRKWKFVWGESRGLSEPQQSVVNLSVCLLQKLSSPPFFRSANTSSILISDPSQAYLVFATNTSCGIRRQKNISCHLDKI